MAFSVTEASHVNTFLRWFLNDPGLVRKLPTEVEARFALSALADSANRRLMAGFTATT